MGKSWWVRVGAFLLSDKVFDVLGTNDNLTSKEKKTGLFSLLVSYQSCKNMVSSSCYKHNRNDLHECLVFIVLKFHRSGDSEER